MRRPVIVPSLGAVVLLACGSQPPGGSSAPGSPASSSPAVRISSSAPSAPASTSSASSDAASSSPDPPAIVCAAACAAGTACALTKRGPACVECAPGSLPTCKDDQFIAVCGDDGALQKTTDCFAQSKRCASGTCQSRECAPNAVHCYEGNVYRCNATGTARTLVATCQTDNGKGTLTLDHGVCQVRRGVPACHTDCFEPDSTILALWGCTPCEPPPDNFCATEGTFGCNDRICRKWPDKPRWIEGPYPAQGPCRRETDGLAVPRSDRRGACEGAGPFGERAVSFQVCRDGHPVAATRKEPCQR